MTTNNRSRRSNRQMGLLKTAMVAGSLAASLLGTRLLAQQDAAQQTAVSNEPIAITVPITLPTAVESVSVPSATDSNTATIQGLSLDLSPIPQAVSPQIKTAPPPAAVSVVPVTTTTSSK
ncbi:MAG: hypothetical protein GY805_16150 [Chloroflexi bacterium]|nr:hypothetical protein [Chloroflexota bacterium]